MIVKPECAIGSQVRVMPTGYLLKKKLPAIPIPAIPSVHHEQVRALARHEKRPVQARQVV
jgi:hypothetical protein